MAKQLKKADNELAAKKEKQEHSISILKLVETSVFVEIWKLKFELPAFNTEKELASFYYSSLYYLLPKSDIFHPPTVIFNV